MSMPIVLAALVALQTAAPKGPDAVSVQSAMNEGVELDFPQFQELAGVKLVHGGATRDGQWLFVCQANLVWKLSHGEFFKTLEDAMDKAFKKRALSETAEFAKAFGAGDLMSDLGKQAISALKSQLGEFEKGDIITSVRFRVRLERAGEDWLVVDSKSIEFDANPLRSLRKQE